MEGFCEIYKLSNFIKEEINNLTNPIVIKGVEFVAKKHSHKENSKLVWLPWQIVLNVMEEITPTQHKLFQKIEEEGTLPNSFYKVSLIFIPKLKTLHEQRTTEQYCS